MSPRTFSRYFPTNDSVIAAAADDMDAYVADPLAVQPLDINEHDALLGGPSADLLPRRAGGGRTLQPHGGLIEIVNSSGALNATAFAFQRGHARQSVQVMGERMGLLADAQAVQFVADIWTTLFATSFMGMGKAGDDPVDAAILCARLEATSRVSPAPGCPGGRRRNPTGNPGSARQDRSDYFHLRQQRFDCRTAGRGYCGQRKFFGIIPGKLT